MTSSNSRDLKSMLRFAMENSDNTKPTELDPERVQWLQAALASASVDPTKQLKEDIGILEELLPKADEEAEKLEAVLDDILMLTEDLDLANDFFKLRGGNILFELILKGPEFLKSQSYQLLANVTQNNPEAQKICVQQNIMLELVTMLTLEKKLTNLKQLLLALSCLTRAYAPAVVQFRKADGFSAVLKVIRNFANDAAAKAVCDKGSFFIFCLLQEVIESSLDENEAKNLTNAIISLCLQLLHVNEHLLAGLIMLFTNSVSVDAAIDVENLPHGTTKRASRFVDESLQKSFVHWLSQMDSRFAESNDPADAELRSYIGVLLNLLNKE